MRNQGGDEGSDGCVYSDIRGVGECEYGRVISVIGGGGEVTRGRVTNKGAGETETQMSSHGRVGRRGWGGSSGGGKSGCEYIGGLKGGVGGRYRGGGESGGGGEGGGESGSGGGVFGGGGGGRGPGRGPGRRQSPGLVKIHTGAPRSAVQRRIKLEHRRYNERGVLHSRERERDRLCHPSNET